MRFVGSGALGGSAVVVVSVMVVVVVVSFVSILDAVIVGVRGGGSGPFEEVRADVSGEADGVMSVDGLFCSVVLVVELACIGADGVGDHVLEVKGVALAVCDSVCDRDDETVGPTVVGIALVGGVVLVCMF